MRQRVGVDARHKAGHDALGVGLILALAGMSWRNEYSAFP
jgi:hypothetical protein